MPCSSILLVAASMISICLSENLLLFIYSNFCKLAFTHKGNSFILNGSKFNMISQMIILIIIERTIVQNFKKSKLLEIDYT